MFNGGVRGKRARDGEGTTSVADNFIQTISPVPYIRNFQVAGQDDLALDPIGGQTVIINGNGFETGLTLSLGGVSVSPVSVVKDQISFTAPAKSAGTYSVLIVNPSGGAAVLAPGIVYSGFPNFDTAAGNIGNFYETTAVSTSVSATADSSITYEIVNGSIPAGTTLNSDGTLTGTAPSDAASTTYTFTVKATDQELQDSIREFSLTVNTDVITWVYPQNNATVEISNEQPTINLSATSAAGYGVVYNVSALPAGLTLGENGEITGTVTENSQTSATLTATALTTDRIGAISVTWSVQLGDAFFNQTTLLLNADNDTFITDASDNAFTITPIADTRPSAFSPYNTGWSNYFDGSGDYLTIARNASFFPVANEDFTFEAWVYLTAAPGATGSTIFTAGEYGALSDFFFYIDPSRQLTLYLTTGAVTCSNTSTLVPVNAWTHVAVSRSGTSTNNVKVFVNGVGQSFTTNNTTVGSGNYNLSIGADQDGNESNLTGYISNIRIVKGTAVYTENFTPPTTPLTAISGTSLLTCQSNRLRDASTNNFTITRNGDVKVTAFAPFTETDTSTGSGYFDGTGDYLQAASNVAFNVGTGNFTMEFWIYPLAHSALYVSRQSSSSGWENIQWWLSTDSVGTLVMAASTYGGGQNFWAGSQILLNTWTHIAIVRDSTAPSGWRIFINGTSIAYALGVGLNYSMESTTVGRPLNIGGFPGWGQTTGYIADFRFVPGTVVYTGNFTPPTAPLTATQSAGTNIAAITGTSTSLLTLQNRIGYNNSQPIDESGIRNIITRNGNASVGTFSPHVPTGWSAYFDGTGDYLTVPNDADFDLTGEFTIEGWLYFTTNNNAALFDTRLAANDGYVISPRSDGTIELDRNGSNVLNGTIVRPLNAWSHFVIVRNASNNLSMFINGVRDVTTTNSDSFDSSTTVHIGAKALAISGLVPITGYVSGLRIVKGTAVYDPTQTTLTVPTAPLEPIANTSLLTLRGPSFTDDSSNRFAITRNGDTRITAFSPFAPHTRAPLSHSVYFDGNGDYLTGPTGNSTLNTALNINAVATDFTVEFWFKLNDVTNANGGTVVTNFTSLGGNGFVISLTTAYDGSGLLFSSWVNNAQTATKSKSNGGNWDLTGWNHAAIVGNGGNLYFYANGVELGTQFDLSRAITTTGTGTGLGIGAYIQNLQFAGYFNGNISDLRIVKGTAVYTSAFNNNLPTAPLTAISGTSLLTCQSPTVIDNSTNAFALTVNGNTQPTQFNPFGETVATGLEYSPVLHGGSVYFDGTGDYLSSGTSTAYTLGTGDFTIEAWLYNFGYAGTQYGRGWCTLYSTAGNYMMLRLNTGSDQLNMWMYLAPSVYFNNYSTALITPYSWTHAAFVRQSGTFKLYINGTLDTTISGVTVGLDHDRVEIGRNDNGYPLGDWNGYISNHRIVKGTAVYTSAFVPPAAPATPIAGTTLLINGTNAAIQDRTGRTVLETVGNTRTLSESPYRLNKSVYFDGSGDYLSFGANDTSLDFGSGDFTLESWVNFSSVSGNRIICSRYDQGPDRGFNWSLSTTNSPSGLRLYVGAGGGNQLIIQKAWTPSVGVWYHIALVRYSNNIYIYINGDLLDTATPYSGTIGIVTNTNSRIGAVGSGDSPLQGYVSNFRIVKGTAVYTADFADNLPTAPLTAISGTSLLTCQSYNFKDNSTNDFTITRNGDAKVTSRGPFTETETENRSMFFDGTGDYLNIYDPTFQNSVGSGDWTFECWMYFNSLPTGSAPSVVTALYHLKNDPALATTVFILEVTSGGAVSLSTGAALIATGTAGKITTGSWIHFACVRSSGTIKTYFDGVQDISTANTTTYNGSYVQLGAWRYSTFDSSMDGFMDDIRITRGVARYTVDFSNNLPSSAFPLK